MSKADPSYFCEIDCFSASFPDRNTAVVAQTFHAIRKGLHLVEATTTENWDPQKAFPNPLPSGFDLSVQSTERLFNTNVWKVTGPSATLVVKVFDYWRRTIPVKVDHQRRPPCPELLNLLQKNHPSQYGKWQTRNILKSKPDDFYSVLVMPYVHTNGLYPHNPRQWIEILEICRTLHSNGYVHGDLLARNMLFPADGSAATLIDFDYSNIKDTVYPPGFNYHLPERATLFTDQDGAKDGMSFHHDLHALHYLGNHFIEWGKAPPAPSQTSDPVELLGTWIELIKDDHTRVKSEQGSSPSTPTKMAKQGATGSPERD